VYLIETMTALISINYLGEADLMLS